MSARLKETTGARSRVGATLRRGTVACVALAATVSMTLGAGSAGAQADVTAAMDPVQMISRHLDEEAKRTLGTMMGEALDPLLDQLRDSATRTSVTEDDAGATTVTWRLDTGQLSESLGGGVSADKELAMVNMPTGVVSSGQVTVTKVSTTDSGEEVRTEIPVMTLDEMEEGVRGAVLTPVATVHQMTSPEAVALYGYILREVANGGSVETLAPLAYDLAAAAGVEVPEDVDLTEIGRGEAEAMVPQMMAMQNVLTGENPLDVLLADTKVPVVERANLMVDVAPGDTLEITTTGEVEVGEEPLTALMPHSMLAGANQMVNQVAREVGRAQEAPLPTLPDLPTLVGLPPLLGAPAAPASTSTDAEYGFATYVQPVEPEYGFATYSQPAGPEYVQVQTIPSGLLDPSMLTDILGPLLSPEMLGSLFGSLESILDNGALDGIFGAIAGGDIGDLDPGELSGSLLAVISELATGIIPALVDAISTMDFTKLTDFINETIANGGLPGVVDPDTGEPIPAPGDEEDNEDGTGDGSGNGSDEGSGSGTESGERDIMKELTVEEAFLVYDTVAGYIDERAESRGGSGDSGDSSTSTRQVSDVRTATEEGIRGSNPGAEGASSVESGGEYNPAGGSQAPSVNYNAAAEESLPVTGASAYTAYYALGGLVLMVLAGVARFGGLGWVKRKLAGEGEA